MRTAYSPGLPPYIFHGATEFPPGDTTHCLGEKRAACAQWSLRIRAGPCLRVPADWCVPSTFHGATEFPPGDSNRTLKGNRKRAARPSSEWYPPEGIRSRREMCMALLTARPNSLRATHLENSLGTESAPLAQAVSGTPRREFGRAATCEWHVSQLDRIPSGRDKSNSRVYHSGLTNGAEITSLRTPWGAGILIIHNDPEGGRALPSAPPGEPEH